MTTLKDVIHIQKNIEKDFQIVLENTPSKNRKKIYDGIRLNRMYRYKDTMLIQRILKEYKPSLELCIIDYNEYDFYAIMAANYGFKVFYINKSSTHFKDYMYHSLILNNINTDNIQWLQSRRLINKFVKSKQVPLLIVNDPADILNSKRLINKGDIHNIIIIRTYEDNLDIYKELHLLNYSFFKIDTHLNKINNISEFLLDNHYNSILCLHPHSKLHTECIVRFD